MTSLDHWSYAAADGAAAPLRTLIRVTPTRKYIERRFPTLGFTIDTGGHPFFEVLLATDRALFDPTNASRRTPANFYASREHSGLIRAGDEPSIYLVPTAVIQRLTGAREIFYTAAGYASAQGKDPAYALPPAQLAREAPSVGVASDFQGRALAASFALPAHVLERVRDDGIDSSAAAFDDSDLPVASYGDPDRDAEVDRGGGEDGYGLTAAVDYDDDYGAINASAQGVEGDEETYAPSSEPAPAAAGTLDYYDGYDEPIPAASAADSRAYGEDGAADDQESAPVTAQQRSYDSGEAVPAMLEDEDENRREHDGTYAAAAYGDEGAGLDDDVAPSGQEYQSLDTPKTTPKQVPLTARDQRRIIDTVLSVAWPCRDYAGVYPETEPSSAPPAGISVGIAPFTQWSGTLGALVKAMEKRDAAAMARFFGPKWKEMRDTVTGKAAERMKPVDGKALWQEPWLARFKKAGAHSPFQAAQNETAAALFLQPYLPYAYSLGLNTDRALLMVAAVARHMSFNTEWPLSPTIDTFVNAISPFKTDALRQKALDALGPAFLKTQQIDPKKGWNNLQHYAALAELRKRGSSPVPLPTLRDMLDLIVKSVTDLREPWAGELAHLRTVDCVQDVEYIP